MHDQPYRSAEEVPGAAAPWVDYAERSGGITTRAGRLADLLRASDLRQRGDQVRQLVRDHGVTYNAPGDGQFGERAWKLDALPVLIGSDES